MKLASKLMLAALGIGLSAQPLMAQTFGSQHKVGLEFRTDWTSTTSDDPDDLNDNDERSKLEVSRARMRFSGVLNESTNYFIRIRHDRDSNASFDGTGDALDNMYLERKLSPEWTFSVGKMSVYAGSRENDYSGMDVYHYSYLTNTYIPGSEVGAQMALSRGGQSLYMQVLNGTAHQRNQKSLSFAAAWYGSWADGMVEPIISYGNFPSTKQITQDSKTKLLKKTQGYTATQSALGTRINLKLEGASTLQIEGEIGNWQTPSYTSGAESSDEELASNRVILVRYDGTQWKPFAKWSSDEVTVAGEVAANYHGFSGGVEFFPDATLQIYRFHLVYIEQISDIRSARQYSWKALNAGFSARFN